MEHLDGALKEVMKQLRGAREEQEQRIHEAIVKKTQEYDKLRLEMESKLTEASHMVAQTRAELIESRAENKVLTHALQERSRVLAEVNDKRARAETEMKVLQVSHSIQCGASFLYQAQRPSSSSLVNSKQCQRQFPLELSKCSKGKS